MPADLIRDEDGATALLPACEGGHVECVKLLLKHGCPPGKPNRHGRTPVMTACFGGQADCLALLLEARASPYEGLMLDSGSGVEGGATPVVMAIDHLGRSADDACVRQLLRADERLRAPLSTLGGAEAAAARAIRAEADAYYAIALTRACASGLSAGVRLLLQARVDPGVPATGAARFSGGEPFAITPLQAAASGASLECVELLLTAGADGRESGTTGKPAEQVASDLGAPECAKAMYATL